MKLEQGLFDGCVLQRNGRGVCEVEFSGTCAAAGALCVSAWRGRRPFAGFQRAKAGRAAGGRFTGRLRGLPVGGPYRIELELVGRDGRAIENLKLNDVHVGDVWVAAGQSNMQGSGLKRYAPPPERAVRAFYMDDRWDIAREPLHNMWACVDEVHAVINGGARPPAPANEGDVDGTLGPAIPFAHAMWEATRVPQAVIPCAHGGSSMSQWDPAQPSLYSAAVRRVRKNGGRVAGVLWYQGCSDTGPEEAAVYTERMKTLIASFRRDCGGADLPVVVVQLCRHAGQTDMVWWNAIQEQQRRLPEVIGRVATVASIDCALRDGIHLDGPGAALIGRRVAQAMLHLQGHPRGQPPIELKGWHIESDGYAACVVVEFRNVVGALRSGSRPSGFFVLDERGVNHVFRIDLDGSRARVWLEGSLERGTGLQLRYGYGRDPYCNIVDGAERSLPVFGPIALGPAANWLAFIRRLRVSEPVQHKGSIRTLSCPAHDAVWPVREFQSDFCTILCDLSTKASAGRLVYARFTLVVPEPMKLALHLGYDGPVKVWVGRAGVYCDPGGQKPSQPDDAIIPLDLQAGRHPVTIALRANEGESWGIFARVERTDVPLQGLCDSVAPRLPEVDA